MKWKQPSITKIYEALGAVADGRVEATGNTAKVFSSTRNKYYEVSYDADKGLIMSNDNVSYWVGELGYPSIAFLMRIGMLPYDFKLGNVLKGVPWKDINQQFKNDFEKALKYILSLKSDEDRKKLGKYVEMVSDEIRKLNLGLLGEKQVPPKGY